MPLLRHYLLLAFLVLMARCALGKENVSINFDRLPKSPRLFLLRDEETALKVRLAADPQLDAVWQLIRRQANTILTEPPVTYQKTGRRLLSVSRKALHRMTHLGMAYRLTSDARYVQRGREEMLAAIAMPDWNPSHFLDVAEMTAAMAIGVDWLHDALDEKTRAQVRSAIIAMGLEPSLTHDQWAHAPNNWNQVCNAGMALGALVVAEQRPDLARQMIQRAIDGVPLAMHEYGPDGAYPEGAMYWRYGTTFNVLFISALHKGLGSDFGLFDQPGFARTADYYLHVFGPSGLPFSYADCNLPKPDAVDPSPAMHYLAAWQKRPELLLRENAMLTRLAAAPDSIKTTDRLLPLLLTWTSPRPAASSPAAVGTATPPTHFVAGGITPVALFRSSWTKDATFIGVKGGHAQSSHGHMDAGTFVIDMLGSRFAEDLGMENYHGIESRGMNLWGSKQGAQRWKIFRLGAQSHSVLMVNGQEHNVTGKATFLSTGPRHARLDLSPVYKGQLASATREMRLEDDLSVTITDKVEARTGGGGKSVVRWAMMTRAKVELQPGGALLHRDNKTVRLIVTGRRGEKMEIFPADPPPAEYDSPNPGASMIGFHATLAPGEKRQWQVQLVPQK